MHPSSSSSRIRKGKGLETVEEEGEPRPNNPHLTLYPLYRQAEAIKDKTERAVYRFPPLAAQAQEYLTHEMADISDAYFDGISGEYPAEAQQYIQEALGRMQGFYSSLSNTMRAQNILGRAQTDPGPRRGALSPAGNAPTRTGESSKMGAGGNQPARSLGVQPGEPENDPAEHGLMHPGGRVLTSPTGSARRVTFGKTTVINDSRAGSPIRRSPSFRSITWSLRRCPGESRREKVKDLWRKLRDRFAGGYQTT
ncbi:hypothetical protein HOY82DRAFT_597506 [Tuber indicum]|nr:hypothetical protein HOY82DRAFT_597506 [Tuber indicum]